jgi:SNW domain-containing protein 1
MQQKIAQKEKEAKEENLRLMAQRAREERNGVVIVQQPPSKVGGTMGGAIANYGSDSDDSDGEDRSREGSTPRASVRQTAASDDDEDEEEEEEGETEEERRAAKERAVARQERRKERERELRMNNMGTEQRAKVLAK